MSVFEQLTVTQGYDYVRTFWLPDVTGANTQLDAATLRFTVWARGATTDLISKLLVVDPVADTARLILTSTEIGALTPYGNYRYAVSVADGTGTTQRVARGLLYVEAQR